MKESKKVRYYQSYDDDFINNHDGKYNIPKNYKWTLETKPQKIYSWLVYKLLYYSSTLYLRIFKGISYKNRSVINKAVKKGVFIYGNHTQTLADVFIPAHVIKGAPMSAIISPDNLAIPLIGKVMPYIGGIPTFDNIDEMRKFKKSMENALGEGRFIVIYPEAHVWDYYTDIRPFSDISFRYPIKYNKEVYCFTTTYQKRKIKKKPRITVFADGPFYPDLSLGTRQASEKLRNEVYLKMKERSLNSNYNYIEYIKK